MLAKDQPSEYARVVAGLAGTSGHVQLHSGVAMDRVPDSLDRNDGTWMPDRPGQGRDDVERIVQAAFQGRGRDARGVYSNRTDKLPLAQQNVAQQVEDTVRAGKQVPVDLVISDAGQLKPDGSNPTSLPGDGGSHPEVIIDQGQMSYPDLMRSHQVLVTGIDADGTVHYRNPWGFEATMTKAEFLSRLTDAIIPD